MLHQTLARDMTKINPTTNILDEQSQNVDKYAIGKPKEWILFSVPNQETITTSLITLS
jgi:hypothetical protein